MALTMLVINVVMHDNQYAVFSARSYLAILIVLVTFIYLYRKQVAINDKQYLEEMIEHHSMALLTSEKILEKTDSYNVAKIAKNIIQRQNDEIVFMKSLVQDIETKS
jgi:Ca2+/Na+ antiporter